MISSAVTRHEVIQASELQTPLCPPLITYLKPPPPLAPGPGPPASHRNINTDSMLRGAEGQTFFVPVRMGVYRFHSTKHVNHGVWHVVAHVPHKSALMGTDRLQVYKLVICQHH